MYKITYDIVAIPATEYLIPNTRQSRHNYLVAYRQIPTLKDYYEGQSKITEPYLITFELSKMDMYLDDISLKLYVIYLIT